MTSRTTTEGATRPESNLFSRISLIWRALLALLLLVGFYVLALGVAGTLLYLPYVFVVYAKRLPIQLFVYCLVAGLCGLSILLSIIPRRDRFIPPGPSLKEAENPAIFSLIREVAAATRQKMPTEVYSTMEMNAWVAQRGGVLGIGGRRVMGLGLPLLQVLSVAQLRGVLAHEFGHFYGGDTRLGMIVYRTRSSIGYTLQGVGETSAFLQKPFVAYAKLFLRVTNAVSRHQEFVADELAGRIAGSRPMMEGLRILHTAGGYFSVYVQTEVEPLLARGFLPPILEGFGNAFALPETQEQADRRLEAALKEEKTNPYDSHPALKERIEALKGLSERKSSGKESPAITLLGDIPSREREVLPHVIREEVLKGLKAISWSEALEQCFMPGWAWAVDRAKAALRGLTPAGIPALARRIDPMCKELVAHGESEEEARAHCGLLAYAVGAALNLALYERGWSVTALPGKATACEKDGTRIVTGGVVESLATGTRTEEEWLKACREAGISDMNLLEEALRSRIAAADIPPPVKVYCPFCHRAAELDEKERRERKFVCPFCRRSVETRQCEEVHSLTAEPVEVPPPQVDLSPALLYCPFCQEIAELNEEERRLGKFTCPTCGIQVETRECEVAPPQLAGEVRCPHCHQVLEFDKAELKLANHTCPSCGKEFGL